MFGGWGYGSDSNESLIYLNDLWRYRKGEGWVWIAGNSTQENGVYEGNVTYPGGRQLATGWTDKEGGLWLFGGFGYGASSGGMLNDLWRFFNGSWEFIGGSDTRYPPANYTESDPTPGGNYGSHVWKFPNGTVWLFGGISIDLTTLANDIWEWEPTSHQWKWLSGS